MGPSFQIFFLFWDCYKPDNDSMTQFTQFTFQSMMDGIPILVPSSPCIPCIRQMAVGSRWISSPPSERRTAAGGRGRFTWCPGFHLQIPLDLWIFIRHLQLTWGIVIETNVANPINKPQNHRLDGWFFNHPQMNRFIIGLHTLWRFILMKSITYIYIYIYNTCYLPTECLYWFGGATSVCLGERVLQLSESQAICGFL